MLQIGLAAKIVIPPSGEKKNLQIAHMVKRASNKISNNKNYGQTGKG